MKLDFDPRKNITVFDNIIMPLKRVKDLLAVRRIVKNWEDIFLFRIGLKKAGFVMQLRNGKRININNQEDYFSFWESYEGQQALLKQLGFNNKVKIIEKSKIIKFKFGNKLLRFHYDSQKQLTNTVGMIKDQFIEQQYKWLDVKNMVVVDIGANIGDSAICFALKGAKHVYAFEPYPYSYNIANKNVNLNRSLSKKITLLNEGCGKSGFITIKKDFQNSVGSDIKNFEKGERIKISDLDEIVKRFKLKHATLKLDCEGCEYALLLNASYSSLNAFDQIILEYHYGYKNLEDKLKKASFRVKRKQPAYLYNKDAENKDTYIGLIYAKKINN